MKPFDLEAAKRGELICTKDDGAAVFFVGTDARGQIVYQHHDMLYRAGAERFCMASRKVGRWVNIYRRGNQLDVGQAYDFEEQARMVVGSNCIGTARVEWEE